MYRRILPLAGLTLLFVINGCSNKEAETRLTQNLNQAQTQLSSQSDSIRALQTALSAKTDSIRLAAQQTADANEKVQNLTEQNHRASGNIATLSRKVDALQEDYESLQESSRQEIFRRDSLLAEINSVFSDTNITLSDVRRQLGTEKVMSQVKSDFIEKVRPWYAKYKHDATKRNFLQVLFASGKAKKPVNPEPSFEALKSTLDSLNTPPPDTTKIKQVSLNLEN